MKNLAKKIKELRMKSGMTQAQLADKLKISASAVGMYEQGRREPDNTMLSKMCKILDASGDYILDLKDNEIKKKEVYDTEKEEVYSVISNFIECLEKQDNLMFNGEPIDSGEKKKIASALKIATAVTLSEINYQVVTK